MRHLLAPAEAKLFKRLDTPAKIQDFLDSLPINFDDHDDTCSSPRTVLKRKSAHCIEAAMLAAAILRFHGQRAWLLDLKANDRDLDHVLCLFKKKGKWGAITKTRYPALRYREPVYASVRELAMSCFHEYINSSGEKTMRSYSDPFSMARYGDAWVVAEGDLWLVANELDESPHHKVLPKGHKLRKATGFETWVGEMTEWENTVRGPRRRRLRL